MLSKIRIMLEKASNKTCGELNFLQKFSWRTCLSPPGGELGGSKNCYVWNIMYWNGKIDFRFCFLRLPGNLCSESYTGCQGQSCLNSGPRYSVCDDTDELDGGICPMMKYRNVCIFLILLFLWWKRSIISISLSTVQYCKGFIIWILTSL